MVETPAPMASRSVNRWPFYLLLIANTVSMVGNVLTMLALPWFVLQSTGSAAKTGVTGFFETLPVVLAAFAGGPLVDRLGFKRMSVAADVASGLAVALIPLLFATVGLPFWGLLTLVFLGNFLRQPGSTARMALMPDVAELAGIPLERANAAYQTVLRLATMLGAPAAGLLIAAFSAHNVLYIDAITFAVSAILVAISASNVRGKASGSNYIDDIREGLRFVRDNRLIRAMLTTVALANLLDAPMFSVLLPVYAKQRFGSAAPLGLVIAGFGAGAVLGTVIYGAVGTRWPRRITFILAFTLCGLPAWVLSRLPGLAVVMPVALFSGFASGPLNPLITSVLQERVPVELRGRMFGLVTAAALAIAPLGLLAAGYAIQTAGLRATFIVMAAAYLTMTLSLWRNPALRDMERA